MSEEKNCNPNAESPTAEAGEDEANPNSISEAEAIANAMMIGQRMRREDKASFFFYGKRLGLAFAGVCVLGLCLLLLYTLTKKDFSPMFGMVVLTLGMLGGVGFWYWATTRSGGDE